MRSNRLAQEKTDGSEDCKRFSPYLLTLEMTDMNALSNNRTWRALTVSFLSFALASCGGGTGPASTRDEELPKIQATAEAAYIFAYPMLENYHAMYLQAINAASGGYIGFNHLQNNTNLAGPNAKVVVRPNNDTLYSVVWLDLRAEPIVISVPEITSRYYSFQFVDMYTFNLGYIGTRTTGTGAGRYLLAGPGWKGSVPAGIDTVFRSEGDFVYTIVRTGLRGETDVPNVMAIQAKYQVQPLSHYLGLPSPTPAVLDPPYPQFPVFDEANALNSAEFILYFNFLLDHVSIDPTEKKLIDSFASIGVGPGRPFNSASLRPQVKSAIEAGVASAQQKIKAEIQALGEQINGWVLVGKVFGSRHDMEMNWNSDMYLVRAAAAFFGLYGNDIEEAYYPSAVADGSGAVLDASAKSYVLHFQPGEIPAVDPNGFWSITMYGADQFLVANSENRYSVGSLTGLASEADGSLKIYLGANAPPNAPMSNWLPAPASNFSLTMRMYLPQPSTLDPLYAPPAMMVIPQ
jgi:hypothetical protein